MNDANYFHIQHHACLIGMTGFVLSNVNIDELPPGAIVGSYRSRAEAFEILRRELVARLEAAHPPTAGSEWIKVQ